jgi:hypothetical protein
MAWRLGSDALVSGVCRDVDVVPVTLIRDLDRDGEDRLRHCDV